ncbi:MAG: hypothetical protein ACRCUT_14260, partial [Spirochaetota bacterium]
MPYKQIIAAVLLTYIFSVQASAQTSDPAVQTGDYNSLMTAGDYKGALKLIIPEIEEINSKRVDDK